MNTIILDGAKASKEVIATLPSWKLDCQPGLGIIWVGEDLRSESYVNRKLKFAQSVGIHTELIRCGNDVGTNTLIGHVRRLNDDEKISAIVIQEPLPVQIVGWSVRRFLNLLKDVDCFHPENRGLLFEGRPRFIPATPLGIIELLKFYGITTSGKEVTIVNDSTIVGLPLASILRMQGPMGNATVTVAHKYTPPDVLEEVCRRADILIVAIGKPKFFTARYVKHGAVVVDVGINVVDGKIIGDVDFDSVSKVASAITPVPGGVGPMTVAMLIRNTIKAASMQ